MRRPPWRSGPPGHPAPSAASSADRIAQQIAEGIAQGAGGKVSNADGRCIGKAILAKLGTAGVVTAGKAASFAAIAFSTRVAMFDAMKQCPAELVAITSAITSGRPTDAQKKKLATQMQKIATACKNAR